MVPFGVVERGGRQLADDWGASKEARFRRDQRADRRQGLTAPRQAAGRQLPRRGTPARSQGGASARTGQASGSGHGPRHRWAPLTAPTARPAAAPSGAGPSSRRSTRCCPDTGRPSASKRRTAVVCLASLSRRSTSTCAAACSSMAFVRLACTARGHERLVAFSCKRRAFCPSYLGRRMTDTALHLTAKVFPKVIVRQWVCSLHWGLRARLGYDLVSSRQRVLKPWTTSEPLRRGSRRTAAGRLS